MIATPGTLAESLPSRPAYLRVARVYTVSAAGNGTRRPRNGASFPQNGASYARPVPSFPQNGASFARPVPSFPQTGATDNAPARPDCPSKSLFHYNVSGFHLMRF